MSWAESHVEYCESHGFHPGYYDGDYNDYDYGDYDGCEDYYNDYDDYDHDDYDSPDYDDYETADYGPGGSQSDHQYCDPADDIRKDDRKSYENDSHCRQLLAELASQRETGEFVDVVVKVEHRRFPCHRAVLASTPYFKAMFSSKLAERKSRVVRLRGINPNSFSKILDYLYTGKICICEDDVQDILQAAHKLQFDKIPEYCREFIQSNLCPSNCVGVMQLADMYGFSTLEKQAMSLAVFHFRQVRQGEEFFTLSTQNLLGLLKNEELPVADEEDVVTSVIRWLDHDREGRKTAVARILRTIHLSCVKVSVLETLESHPVVQQSSESLAMIRAAKEEHLRGTQELQAEGGEVISLGMTRSRLRIGLSDDLAIIVGGWKAVTKEQSSDEAYTEPMPLQSIICLNPDTEQCYHITDLPTTAPGYMSVTRAGQRLYVTGGRANPLHLVGDGDDPQTELSRQAFQYDVQTDTWTKLADMPGGRAGHQSAVIDGKLFLVGGDVEDTSQMCMDCLDLEKGFWTTPVALPTMFLIDTSSDLAVTAFEGNLVLLQVLKNPRKRPEDDHEPLLYWWLDCDHLGLKSLKLCVHTFNVEIGNWRYTCSDCDVQAHKRKVTPMTTAVDGNLYILLSEDHSDYNNVFTYHAQTATLSKVSIPLNLKWNYLCAGQSLCSYVDEQKSMDKIASYRVDTGGRIREARRPIFFPFGVFGHGFLDTKKSSFGWYCRDFAKMENEKEGED